MKARVSFTNGSSQIVDLPASVKLSNGQVGHIGEKGCVIRYTDGSVKKIHTNFPEGFYRGRLVKDGIVYNAVLDDGTIGGTDIKQRGVPITLAGKQYYGFELSEPNLSNAFSYAENFNQDISQWNTVHALDMRNMFFFASSFNQPIGRWDTRNVANMASMFGYDYAFDQDITHWNTSQVKDFSYMFANCQHFDRDISGWKTTSARKWNFIFMGCSITDAHKPPKFK